MYEIHDLSKAPENIVERFKDGDMFSFEITIKSIHGNTYSMITPRTDRQTFEGTLEQYRALAEGIDTIMRNVGVGKKTDNGVVTVGTWHIRGDLIEAFEIVPYWHEHVDTIH